LIVIVQWTRLNDDDDDDDDVDVTIMC